MGAKVRIPTPLRRLTNGQPVVEVTGNTVKDLIDNLNTGFPGFAERICDDNGSIRNFINIFVNEEDIRFLNNLDTLIKDGDEVSIVPAIAGGLLP
ncbi:MAG: MoaD/ThiS family protein [Candidatus Tectomicrobia bacterium]|uniref:MoaD/ThiS family protein n=1 Tax=Tectimicrobiota bacterium TaxID=2528274 RepID=A0A933GN74_UNCTE|nr:MoaD/ThiS family protein [Candidatus Tectomicrobia bacterium]